jgi:hypothetical protein
MGDIMRSQNLRPRKREPEVLWAVCCSSAAMNLLEIEAETKEEERIVMR